MLPMFIFTNILTNYKIDQRFKCASLIFKIQTEKEHFVLLSKNIHIYIYTLESPMSFCIFVSCKVVG